MREKREQTIITVLTDKIRGSGVYGASSSDINKPFLSLLHGLDVNLNLHVTKEKGSILVGKENVTCTS
jgi:hypothetical protein